MTAASTGRAAGRLWDLRRMGPIERIEVRLPHFAQTLSGPDILLRRCNVLDEVDVVTRGDGIRVVSPPRLLFDLGAVPVSEHAVRRHAGVHLGEVGALGRRPV